MGLEPHKQSTSKLFLVVMIMIIITKLSQNSIYKISISSPI